MMYESFQSASPRDASGFTSRLPEIASREHHDIAGGKEVKRRKFRGVVPAWGSNRNAFNLKASADKARADLTLKLDHGWHKGNVADVFRSEFAYGGGGAGSGCAPVPSKQAVLHHSSKAHEDVAWHPPRWSMSEPLERRRRRTRKSADAKDKAFVILERAKHMLGRQRIRDARELLQRGVVEYPDDEQLIRLLRAISPGRVLRVVGSVPDRTKEMAWIRANGPKYRNQWVAIEGSVLLACAGSLRELLDSVSQQGQKNQSPLLQKIASE